MNQFGHNGRECVSLFTTTKPFHAAKCNFTWRADTNWKCETVFYLCPLNHSYWLNTCDTRCSIKWHFIPGEVISLCSLLRCMHNARFLFNVLQSIHESIQVSEMIGGFRMSFFVPVTVGNKPFGRIPRVVHSRSVKMWWKTQRVSCLDTLQSHRKRAQK